MRWVLKPRITTVELWAPTLPPVPISRGMNAASTTICFSTESIEAMTAAGYVGFAERGVRFTQIFHRGWDQHGNVTGDLPNQCRDIDQPAMALIQDLKQRGMLDDTLVIWGGEFGRTVYCQGPLSAENYGRDHHPKAFTMWLAGGGVRGGVVHGETDDFSYNITEDPVDIQSLNATTLHLLGVDHERLTYRFNSLDNKLTGVDGNPEILREILT